MSHEKTRPSLPRRGETTERLEAQKARASRTPETGQSAEVAQDVPTV